MNPLNFADYRYQRGLATAQKLDFLAPLLLRFYLAPIFILAGWHKLSDLESTAYYFGEYLGLPFPELMALLAGTAEFVGGIGLLLGLGVRIFALPLMITMVVAAVTAHWDNGWHVLPETQLTMPWEWRGDLIDAASERKQTAISLLQQHGHYDWLTEAGSFTILKNGIEFAASYFVMLLALFYLGAGRFISIDYWLSKLSHRHHERVVPATL
ncbi:membrane protein [Shewanella mangrovi]|uniref:Membrane protein n=1 Tax=Shewanella mangrovi TaxID=1515746 RepID=A0A094JEX3_9GAMM|nr:DoxX family protein [Shewanella mangrovi]KFZ37767.1 membrane protein [Shewanella mangrovi]